MRRLLYERAEATATYTFVRLQPHIEEQKLSGLVANTLDLDLSRSSSIGNVRAITLTQLDIANLDLCATGLWLRPATHNQMHEYISLSLGHDIVSDALARAQDASIHAQIRMQRDRLIFCVCSTVAFDILHDPNEFILLHLICEFSGHVGRLQAFCVRLCPNLQKMHVFVFFAIVL